MSDHSRPWYRLHGSTLLIGMLMAVVFGFFMTSDNVWLSFSGKRTTSGFPWTYRSQEYRNRAAFGTSLASHDGESPRQGYDLITDSGIDYQVLSVDVGVGLLMMIVPAAVCEWFLRRRRGG